VKKEKKTAEEKIKKIEKGKMDEKIRK